MAKTRPAPMGRARRATPAGSGDARARPVRAAGRGRGLDQRVLIVAASLLVIAGIVAFSLVGRGGGAGGGARVGQVTETAVGGPAAGGMLAVGSAAPDLKWTLGGTAESVAGLRGNVVLLEFFATWCPHCQAEAPLLSRVADAYAARGLRAIGVNSSPLAQDQRSPTSVGDVESYAGKYGVTFPQLMDKGLVGAQRYGVRGFPTVYILDKSGVIRFAQSGEVPESTLKDAIEQALALG